MWQWRLRNTSKSNTSAVPLPRHFPSPPLSVTVMFSTVSTISSSLMKKGIPFSAPNSTTLKSSKDTPSLLFSSTIPNRRIINDRAHGKSNLISSLVSPLLVHHQSTPPEIRGMNPPEFPKRSNDDLPSIPPEVPELPQSPEIETSPPAEEYIEPPKIPEVPNPEPDFPVPPLPFPPTPPDVPLPPPGTPRPLPPNRLPPKLPPDPDIIPPPPEMPDIKPPPGPYVL